VLKEKLCKKLHILPEAIQNIEINKKSLDGRVNHNNYVYSLIFETKISISESNNVKKYKEEEVKFKKLNDLNYLVVGFGPSGLFFSLFALYSGVKVTIIERGKKIEDRIFDVEQLEDSGIFNLNSNNLFGEGGAGTFSDGKLQSGINSSYIKFVLNELVKFGADPEILLTNKPHIGTDKLRNIIVNIRNYLLDNGVKIYFNTLFTNFSTINNQISVQVKSEFAETFLCDKLILAFGANDNHNYKILYDNNLNIIPKDFSIGVRIEHLRKSVDDALNSEKENLIGRSYKYFAHLGERTCYTFCMCPGGYVIPTPSEANTIVINGMSYNARNAINSNSALLINVKVSDYYIDNPLDGFEFRKKIEEKAFNNEHPYAAPVQKVEDFLENKVTDSFGKVLPSIKNYYFTDLNTILPEFISSNLKLGIKSISERFSVFKDKDAVLTGVETRSSSPVLLKRENGYTMNIENIYSIGDGSGYSGGITSAIIDALKLIFFLN
jgi:uncharacterized FAD-dependent dehydrogenase